MAELPGMKKRALRALLPVVGRALVFELRLRAFGLGGRRLGKKQSGECREHDGIGNEGAARDPGLESLICKVYLLNWC